MRRSSAIRWGASPPSIGAAQTSAVSSVCDADYAPALQGIAQKIIARLL